MADEVHDLEPDVSIVPGVSILGVLSNLNYEPWYALAEYVDNSLQSAARSILTLRRIEPNYQLNVDISYDDSGEGRISITDNAGGIARRDFKRAFRAAEVPPDRSGLSEFGMGMKSASIWFAKNWRVITTSVGDPNIYTVEFDMRSVLENSTDRLRVETEPGPRDDHYTRIELWNLNQFLRARTLGKVRDHLREIYREFLRDDRLILTVHGQNMEYEDPRVLRAPDARAGSVEGISDEEREWKKTIEFKLDSGVRIKGWAAIRAEGKTSGNGFSLFRRGRVILGIGDTPYRPPRIFGQGNSYRSQRLFGELHVEGLPVSHTKDGFQWHGQEEEFEEKLRGLLDAEPLPLLKQAEHFRARQATRTELKRVRVATDNTVAASERALPAAVPLLSLNSPLDAEEELTPVLLGEQEDVSRSFSFDADGQTWIVSITAADRPAEPKWLVHHTEVEPGSGNVTAHLVLNVGHPLLKQFAVGSTDALEAVLRIAVALVVSESVQKESGDGESAARFLRQVNSILSGPLSARGKAGL